MLEYIFDAIRAIFDVLTQAIWALTRLLFGFVFDLPQNNSVFMAGYWQGILTCVVCGALFFVIFRGFRVIISGINYFFENPAPRKPLPPPSPFDGMIRFGSAIMVFFVFGLTLIAFVDVFFGG